jgi:hypothetical protein
MSSLIICGVQYITVRFIHFLNEINVHSSFVPVVTIDFHLNDINVTLKNYDTKEGSYHSISQFRAINCEKL